MLLTFRSSFCDCFVVDIISFVLFFNLSSNDYSDGRSNCPTDMGVTFRTKINYSRYLEELPGADTDRFKTVYSMGCGESRSWNGNEPHDWHTKITMYIINSITAYQCQLLKFVYHSVPEFLSLVVHNELTPEIMWWITTSVVLTTLLFAHFLCFL